MCTTVILLLFMVGVDRCRGWIRRASGFLRRLQERFLHVSTFGQSDLEVGGDTASSTNLEFPHNPFFMDADLVPQPPPVYIYPPNYSQHDLESG